jgi:hypothetical protein
VLGIDIPPPEEFMPGPIDEPPQPVATAPGEDGASARHARPPTAV